jgi:hypothetical protein
MECIIELKAGLFHLVGAFGHVGCGAAQVKCFQRRPVHDKRDRHFVRAAHAGVVVADVAHDEIDLIEIGQVIDHLGLIRRGGLRARGQHRNRHDRAGELQQ